MKLALIGHSDGHMSSGCVGGGGLAVLRLVVKEHIRRKRLQKLRFAHAAEKKGFIEADVPSPQGADDPFMGRSLPGGDQDGANGAVPLELLLQVLQGAKKDLNGPPGRGLVASASSAAANASRPSFWKIFSA